MPYSGQPTLMGLLGMAPMQQIIKTRLFGEPYILFSQFTLVCSYLYETGAILGRAKHNKLTELVKMGHAQPGRENEVISFMHSEASKRLDKFGEEPTSFHIFILSGILENVGLDLKAVLTPSIKAADKKIFEEKWSVKKVEPFIKLYGLEGIGFGSLFPELTEKMYRNVYKNIDMDEWSEARAHGLAIPERQSSVISFDEREKLVLSMVAAYTSECYPELLDPLDLRGCLEV